MKKVALLSFTLCLTVFSVCLGEGESEVFAFWKEFVNLTNSWRRQTEIKLPNGETMVVYRKEKIDEIIQKCHKVGACSENYISFLRTDDGRIFYKGGSAGNHRLLDLVPSCEKAAIFSYAPAQAQASKSAVSAAPVEKRQSPLTEVLAKKSPEEEKPATFCGKYRKTIMWGAAGAATVGLWFFIAANDP